MMSGVTGPFEAGWKLQKKKGRRKASAIDVYHAFQDHVTPSEFGEIVTVPWGALEERFVENLQSEAHDRGDRLTKKAAKEIFKGIADTISTQAEGVELRRRK